MADTEPPSDTGRNTGVSGTTQRAVVENTGRQGRDAGSWLAPIRYAHSGTDPTPPPGDRGPAEATRPLPAEPVPTPPVPTPPVPTLPVPAPRAAGADYDETAGLVYEAPHQERPGQPGPGYAPPAEPTEPTDEGLAILGGMATTEVPDSFPPGHTRPPADYEPPPTAPPTAELPSAGASWNQPFTSAPQAVDGGEVSRPRPFGKRMSGQGSGVWRRGPAPGVGGSKATVRDLPPDVQMRFYRLRVTLMIVVGLAFWFLTSWEIGLTAAILAGIADTIWRSWNAASYANGASQSGAQWRTRRQLARMRRAGYLALDARRIPNSPEVIDHLVIGPTGVYAIDSEKWNPKLPIRTWNGKKLYHGPQSQKSRLEHAAWEAQQASEILSAALGTQITVRPALAIYGPKIPWDIAEIRNVDVFSGPALRKYLRRRARTRDVSVPKLTREQVRTIRDTASRLLPDLSQTPAPTPVG